MREITSYWFNVLREITSYWFNVLREITSYWFDVQKRANFKQLFCASADSLTVISPTCSLPRE